MNHKDFVEIIENNTKADKNVLKDYILSILPRIPIPTVNVNKDTFIERAVIISHTDGDFDLDRLSYIPSKLKHLASEGRFNNAEESIFYAAFTDLDTPSATRFFLATELDHSILGYQNKTFNITVTKWLSKTSYTSLFFVFKDEYCTNDLTTNAFKELVNSNEFRNLSREDKEFLELITEEFSKTDSANKYDITNIVFDFYKRLGYNSIIYPGVRSRYRGNNIAMFPSVVDDCWECCFGAEFILVQNGDNIKMDAVKKINLKGKKLVYSDFGKSEFGEEITIKK
ncbi:hypothetical protein [Persicobacter diffluens]|uniref:RES domain-containing protein n=1 Tax=Persicobacter diffluens TaxID=981 RepID=A0AAN4W3B2_9BACT|nr:hypothetical protein PEDI_37670 [Persicobacter diffluens]